MNLSVVIVNYKAGDALLRCLESIAAHAPEAEVVLVDNASGDLDIEALRGRFPRIRIIQNDNNEGFPVATNQGIAEASGKYVLLLNPDAELRPGAAQALVAYLEDHPDAGIVGPRLIHPDGTPQESAWRVPTVGGIVIEYLCGRSMRGYGRLPAADTDVETLSGAALAFSVSFVRGLGGLDPALFWIEDVDLCVRARRAGRRVVYLPSAEVVHSRGVSARKNEKVAVSNQIFNKIKFFGKYGSRADRAVIVLISLAHVLAKALVLTLLSPFSRTCAEKARAYWYTAPRVFRPPARGGGL